MPEVTPYLSSQDAALALIQEHALNTHGIADADPLKVVADIMMDPQCSKELRLKAATTALKYTRTELRATTVDITGKINHEHSHVVERATEQVWALLDDLQNRKARRSKEAVEGILIVHPSETH